MAQTVNDYRAILSDFSWWTGTFLKRPVFLTYSFEDAPYDYLSSDGYSKAFINSFRPFNPTEKAAARDALGQWDAASGITFLEAPAGQGDVRFANYDLARHPDTADAAAFAYYPLTFLSADFDLYYSADAAGDVFVGTASMGDSQAALTHILDHEIGHAIGLKHPFDGAPVLDPTHDTDTYTVMSYNGSAPKLGTFDVQAAQSLYGTDAQDGSQVARWSWDAQSATLTQTGNARADMIRGVASADIIRGGGGRDVLFGSGGDDVLDGGTSNDRIEGEQGDDQARGGKGNDQIDGGLGDDVLSGEAGRDTLDGSLGDDRLDGGDDRDDLEGGDGDDILAGGRGDDVLRGGRGFDTADYGAARKSVTVLMAGTEARGDDAGTDTLNGIENVTGGASADAITGNDIANVLDGGADSDVMDGGRGNDTLIGATGRDTLTGGAGSDHFVFDGKYGGSNFKVITDFKPGSDKLVLDLDAFHALKHTKDGALHSAFHAGTAAHDASDRVIYDGETGRLYYDVDGTGGHGVIKIAQLEEGLNLRGSDFLLMA